MDIDDSLYSRQRYMLGDQAMKKMMSSHVLLLGCDCLGVEIAKNLALTGIGKLEIADSNLATEKDILTNFYVTKLDVDSHFHRAAACAPRVKELNPYVNVSVSYLDTVLKRALNCDTEAMNELKGSLDAFDCVICSQLPLDEQMLLDKICRELGHVKFVSASVFGLFSSVFCDFGENFEVHDATGEHLKENFIGNIATSTAGLVTCLENEVHGLETGDLVMLKSVIGMSGLNGQVREIEVVSSNSFNIGDTTSFTRYESGGMFKQVKRTIRSSHESLAAQLSNPSILPADFGKLENPMISHAAFIALNDFCKQNKRFPNPGEASDAENLYMRYLDVIKQRNFSVSKEASARNIIEALSFTCSGFLSPLCAAIGGIVSQEALKSLTGKYTPLNQWLYVDAIELYDRTRQQPETTSVMNSPNEVCLGNKLVNHLSALNIFMVGCGAIGCEMLKNLTLLGVSSGSKGGKLTMTDNDAIEKSNLNRQFLFKGKHVGMSKSVVAGSVAKEINPNINVECMQHKVCPDTQDSVFTDLFFKSKDIIVNALDNVEARRYMDARCVSNQLPLVESGTMGPKGHVQVVVPFLTESYSSQSDPADIQYLFCTLKTFPSRIEHTIQWARDKFETLFSQKPVLYNKFWGECQDAFGTSDSTSPSPDIFKRYLISGASLSDAYAVVKLLNDIPDSWVDCVQYARCKFEFFFNHKAKRLISAFPLDSRLEDGSLFWSLPKRPPTPIVFDSQDSLHMQFVISLASLVASIHDVPVPSPSEIALTIHSALEGSSIPEFVPSNKEIVTDESAAPTKSTIDEDINAETLGERLDSILALGMKIPKSMSPEIFEKDDDSNCHIDFISATANLRALMYGIEMVDKLEVKRIAGRIIPAIATTTSAVAGFATIQFLQLAVHIIKNRTAHGSNWVEYSKEEAEEKLSTFRNAFLNLALPIVIFSEPAPPQRTAIGSSFSFTEWDQWEVKGGVDFKLNDLVEHFRAKLQLEVSAVLHGAKIVYMSFMPGHPKKLKKQMASLIKTNSDVAYVDLAVTFTNDQGDDDFSCPIVRYFL